MAIATTSITNVSKQVVPILVGDVPVDRSSPNSGVKANLAAQLQIPPGSQVTVETRRLDLAQINQLASKGLIIYN